MNSQLPRHVWRANPPWTERLVCSLCGLETTLARISQVRYSPHDEVCSRSHVERKE